MVSLEKSGKKSSANTLMNSYEVFPLFSQSSFSPKFAAICRRETKLWHVLNPGKKTGDISAENPHCWFFDQPNFSHHFLGTEFPWLSHCEALEIWAIPGCAPWISPGPCVRRSSHRTPAPDPWQRPRWPGPAGAHREGWGPSKWDQHGWWWWWWWWWW